MKRTFTFPQSFGMKFANLRMFSFSMLIYLASISMSFAQGGSLDTTFGATPERPGTGKITGSVSSGTGSSRAQDVVIQPDGKIVVAVQGSNPDGSGGDFSVVRYNASDGSLDTSYGNGGVSRFSFTAASDSEIPKALALHGDGIIVAGIAPIGGSKGSSNPGFAIARLTSNGMLDPNFGSNGKVLFSFSSREGAAAKSIAIQSDGKILVGGNTSSHFAVARLNLNGSLDKTFNGTGFSVVQFPTKDTTFDAGARGLALQRLCAGCEEKIVMVGVRPSVAATSRDFAVIRLNLNGTADSSFGNNGQVFTDFAGMSDYATGVAIDATNNIVVAGLIHVPNTENGRRIGVARYQPNGSPESNFNGGKVIVGVPGYSSDAESLAIDAVGNIVVAGTHQTLYTGDFMIARLLGTNGSLDPSFGNGGIVTTDFEIDFGLNDAATQQKDNGLGLGIQPWDGRMVVVGHAVGGKWLALARYQP